MGVKRAHDDAGGVVCISVRRKNVSSATASAAQRFLSRPARRVTATSPFTMPSSLRSFPACPQPPADSNSSAVRAARAPARL